MLRKNEKAITTLQCGVFPEMNFKNTKVMEGGKREGGMSYHVESAMFAHL